jgi:4'-phosphopantetheinyl transferase
MPKSVYCRQWSGDVRPTSVAPLLRGNYTPSITVTAPNKTSIWCIPNETKSTEDQLIYSMLTSPELARAERFKHKGAKQLFVTAHASLHLILKNRYHINFDDFAFSETEHHKPFLTNKDGVIPLEFNLSHGGQWIAITIGTQSVGIDIEEKKDLKDFEGISRIVYTELENNSVIPRHKHPDIEQFYRHWSCKEAFLKAEGTGFMQDPKGFELNFKTSDKNTHPIVWWTDEIPGHALAWTERIN